VDPQGQEMLAAKRRVLEALWRDRMHTEPRALELSAARVHTAYDQIWGPAQRMRTHLAAFPVGLLAEWEASGRGHLVYTHRRSGYLPGLQTWQGQELVGLCDLSVDEIAFAPGAALEAVCALIDHVLGSHADPHGPWLADGGGVTPALQELAERFQRVHALGYGHAELGVASAREYLARTWALYLTDPQRLNVLDPQVHRLYRDTLMSERFWARS
jgi:hypothetical protein